MSDAAGVSKVVEFNYASDARETVVTPTNIVTNFYLMNNEYYGHGYEHYIAVQRTLAYDEVYDYSAELGLSPTEKRRATGANKETARESRKCWSALRNSSQEPVEGDPTSNTQWSILFDSAAKTAEISIRRKWEDIYAFNINGELLWK